MVSRCPLDALCNCLAFSPLHERICCAALARRWHEAVTEPSLWAKLIPETEDLSSLSSLLKRFGSHVKYLKIASHGPFRLAASLNLEQLSTCRQLEELFLGGFRGRDLESFCQRSCRIESLKVLTIECDPYFNLGSFSHNTGAHMASLPVSWLSSFPNLERLVCDYLKLEMNPQELQELPSTAACSDSEEDVNDSAAASVSVTPAVSPRPLELPRAALRRESRENGEEVETCQALEKLKELNFVAIVRGHGSTWNSPHCRCDLSVLAVLAPALEKLQLRSPNIALGRMSRRPGQRMEGLLRVSRHFCSSSLRDLLAAGYLLPHLKELKVEVVKDDTGPPWDSAASILAKPTAGPATGTGTRQLRCRHLALLLGVHDRPFQLSLGAADPLVSKLQLAAEAMASGSSMATFHAYAVAEQHLPLLQLLERFQEVKELPSCNFQVDIAEVA